MTYLIAGLVIFLGVHSVSIAANGWRDAQVERSGEGSWKGIYSLASIVGMVLIVYGYAAARSSPVVVYLPPPAMRMLTLVVMLPVFPLLFAVYLPGRIKSATAHPMLLGTFLWGVGHLLANGMLADVLLFGGFALWALIDRLSFARRVARALPTAPPGPFNDLIAVVGGLLVYALVLFWAHRALIGIGPLG